MGGPPGAAAPPASTPEPATQLAPSRATVSLRREEACHPASPSWRTVALVSGFLVSLPSCRGVKGF